MTFFDMDTKESLEILSNEEKFHSIIENYLIYQGEEKKNHNQETNRFYALQEPNLKIPEYKISVWEFMKEAELNEFLTLRKRSEIKRQINYKMNQDYPKGNARTLYIEFMYNVRTFCRKWRFSLEKSGAIMSQFHLTHIYFTNSFDTSAEKAYLYFKDLAMSHSLPFLPQSNKIFSHSETKIILEFFCKLYLRFLPLIRFLSLPNFAFYLEYNLEPEQIIANPSLANTNISDGKVHEQGKTAKTKKRDVKTNKKGKN